MSSNWRIVALAVVMAMLLVAAATAMLGPRVGAGAAPEPSVTGPQVRQAARHDLSLPLGEMEEAIVEGPNPPAFAGGVREMPPRRGPRQAAVGAIQPGSPRDLLPGAHPARMAMPAPLVSFEGVGNADNRAQLGYGVMPPDTNGDIGPNHYVQMLNRTYSIFDRNGNRLAGPSPTQSLWSGLGGLCEISSRGDPIVLYDPMADRWLMSEFAFTSDNQGNPVGPFYECIAISQTPDPTGAWYRYAFLISATKMNDYPKLGVWPDGYYMSVNQFYGGSGGWAGTGVAVFERDKMLQGEGDARMVYFDVGQENLYYFGLLPSDLDGPNLPPAGSPNYFAAWDDSIWIPAAGQDALRIWEFDVNWSDPSLSTFGQEQHAPNQILPTANVDPDMCGYANNCIPQRGTTQRVDAISDRLMHRLAYRRFDDHEALVSNHTVDVGGDNQAGIHWFELRRTEGAWSLQQEGVHAPDDLHRWMGSIAMDRAGNMALGYSVSAPDLYPSIRYTGRLAGDPAGQMAQGEATLIAGSGSQLSYDRWGDYSMMAVDPSDDCTFWYTQEYYSADGIDWQTRIGAFKFPSCQPREANLAVDKSATLPEVSPGQAMTYTLAYTNVGTTYASGVVISDVVPGELDDVAFESNRPAVPIGPVKYTWEVGVLAPAESGLITLTGRLRPEVTRPSVFTNTASIRSSATDPDPSDNRSSVRVKVAGPRAYLPLIRKGWPGER
jgi:uncharacterized repeat protein (TIGR01451 family)